MESDDSLVRKKWVEWWKFNKEWPTRSYDDFDNWLKYQDKRGPELRDIAIKWKIFHYPKKDNKDEDRENISFTPEFQSFWRPKMKFLFHVNEGVLDNVVRNKEFSAFVEYGFVQIISQYIDVYDKDYYDLPRSNPEKLKTIFELSRIVFRMFDNELNDGFWDRVGKQQEEILKERAEFKKKIGMSDADPDSE